MALTPQQTFNLSTGTTTYTFTSGSRLTDGSVVSGFFTLNNDTGAVVSEDITVKSVSTVAQLSGAESFEYIYNVSGKTNDVSSFLAPAVNSSASGTSAVHTYSFAQTAFQNGGSDTLNISLTNTINSSGVETVKLNVNGSASSEVYQNTNLSNYGITSNFSSVSGLTATPIVCYAKGTLIHTERGYISVEKLKVGDGVRTVSGSYEPIVWLGHRSVDIKRHTNPAEANPVRICKDAFGIDQPSSDLFLSPLHSVYVDGIFIPAIDLVNGTTVIQEKRSQITYYHIELPTHNAIYAQGLTAESYLDDSNRNFFIDDTTGQVVDMTAQFAEKTTTQQEAKASTQWFATVLRNGPEVEAVKARLEANAVKRVKRVA